MTPGPHPFHGSETFGVLGVLSTENVYTLLGLVADGQLRFDSAATTPAASIAGSFDATTYQSLCFGAGAE